MALMPLSRRQFMATTAAAALASQTPAGVARTPVVRAQDVTTRFDPWVEVDGAALRFNVEVISRLVRGRPIMAVIKNNAYGLGLTTVASLLEPLPQIAGFAVVKTAAALALRAAGITKPVLLMGLFADQDAQELIRQEVSFSLCTEESSERLGDAARTAGTVARAHVYLDTGMSRMGVPYHRALPWLATLAGLRGVRVEGVYMEFTEEPDFDREQLARFREVTGRATQAGVMLGRLHAASSNAVFNFADAHLDLVRPGIALYGAYPSDAGTERVIAELQPALRVRARVVRVEELRTGDSVSYGRNFVATRPTWVATVPMGHADGYPRQAVNGARVLINGRLYPAIGAVSASHTIVELGPERTVAVGDVVTVLGPDDPAIHPNAIADGVGISVYDVLMHLNPALPKLIV